MTSEARNTRPANPGNHRAPSPYSELLPDFVEALECLYIRSNVSGRRIFVDNWPHAVRFIFDQQILTFDRDGIGEQKNKNIRKKLELEAEKNRQDLFDTVANIETLAVDDGLLQLEFLKKFIAQYGRDFSLYVFAEHIVDKFAPASGKSETELSEEEMKVQEEKQEEAPAEKEVIEEETYLTDEQRAELLDGMVPKAPEVEKPKEEEKPKRRKMKDPTYRPPVINSSSSSENNN